MTTRKQSSSPLHLRIATTTSAIKQNTGNRIICTRSTSLQMTSSGNDDESLENDDATNLSNKRPAAATTPFSATPWDNPKSLVGSLLEKTTSRAIRTLSANYPSMDDVTSTKEKDPPTTPTVEDVLDATIVRMSSVLDGGNIDSNARNNKNVPTPTTEDVLDATIVRISSVLDGSNNSHDVTSTKENDVPTTPTIEHVLDATIVRTSSILDDNANNNDSQTESNNTNSSASTIPAPKKQQDKQQTYIGNPSVTPTALAHSLWKSTIIPHQDTVIDATCGNGKDCLALARMLFPDSIDDEDSSSSDIDDASSTKPQLIGIDIQSRAIHNTQRKLLSSLPSDIYYNHVALLTQSHEYLMDVPRDKSSVGLVCYNLGYLPGAPTSAPTLEQPETPSNYKDCKTQTQTTLNSITDASLLLRVGGLLSIMTYANSNVEESRVVEHFVEGLAMLTTREAGGWQGYADRIPDYDDHGGGGRGGVVRTLVTRALERVVARGAGKQTWRAFVHKPLGRPLSPVLVTAMRIK